MLFLFSVLKFSCGQSDQKLDAVRLYLSLVGCAISMNFSACTALVKDHVALLCIGLYANGLHVSATGIGSVSRIDVHVQGPQAEGAVIAGGITQRLDLLAAMLTDKSVVIFGESFLLHFDLLKINTLIYYSIKRMACQGEWQSMYDDKKRGIGRAPDAAQNGSKIEKHDGDDSNQKSDVLSW
jgi:hypothetical protein